MVYCIIGFSSPLQKLEASYVPTTKKLTGLRMGDLGCQALHMQWTGRSRVVKLCCHTMMSAKSH